MCAAGGGFASSSEVVGAALKARNWYRISGIKTQTSSRGGGAQAASGKHYKSANLFYILHVVPRCTPLDNKFSLLSLN